MSKLHFTRIKNDVNGNPRYVCHYLALGKDYQAVVKIANKAGGRKYHTKAYGGGIVFQSYNLDDTVSHLNELFGTTYEGGFYD